MANDVSPYIGSVVEAAHYLRISRVTVYRRMADDATFPRPRKIGQRNVFLKSDLDAWVLSHDVEA